MKIWAPLLTSGRRARKAYLLSSLCGKKARRQKRGNRVANRFCEASFTHYHYNPRQRREPATRRSCRKVGISRKRTSKTSTSVLHKRNLGELTRDRPPLLTRARNSDSRLLTERRSTCFLRNIIRLPAECAGLPPSLLIRGESGGPAPSALRLHAYVRRSF